MKSRRSRRRPEKAAEPLPSCASLELAESSASPPATRRPCLPALLDFTPLIPVCNDGQNEAGGDVNPCMSMARRSNGRAGSPARFAARMLPGARPSQFPGFIAPCNPTLKPVVPTGERWLYEIKHDGYRMQAHLAEGRSALLASSGLNWTGRLRSLVAPLKELPASSNCISIFSTKHVGKVGTGFSRKVVRAAPRSGLARHTLLAHLVAALRWMSLGGTLGEAVGAFPFLGNELHNADL